MTFTSLDGYWKLIRITSPTREWYLSDQQRDNQTIPLVRWTDHFPGEPDTTFVGILFNLRSIYVVEK